MTIRTKLLLATLGITPRVNYEIGKRTFQISLQENLLKEKDPI